MSDRPWLEALKDAMRERSADTDTSQVKYMEALPSEGRERYESLVDESTLVVDETVRGPWGEEERGLIAAGWKPKERCGRIIWKPPDNGLYVSQEIAIHFLDSGSGTLGTKAGQLERGNTTV